MYRVSRFGYEVRSGSYMMRFLPSQDNHDTLLEVQRSQALEKAAISIQRVLRGYKYRCCLHPKSLPSPHTCLSCALGGPAPHKPGTYVPSGSSLWVTVAQDLSEPPDQEHCSLCWPENSNTLFEWIFWGEGRAWGIHYISKSQKCHLWFLLYFDVLL